MVNKAGFVTCVWVDCECILALLLLNDNYFFLCLIFCFHLYVHLQPKYWRCFFSGGRKVLLLFLHQFCPCVAKNVKWQKVWPILGSLRVEQSNILLLLYFRQMMALCLQCPVPFLKWYDIVFIDGFVDLHLWIPIFHLVNFSWIGTLSTKVYWHHNVPSIFVRLPYASPRSLEANHWL